LTVSSRALIKRLKSPIREFQAFMIAKAKVRRRGILVPEELLKEMVSTCVRMEQILATLETIEDKRALKAILRSKEEIAKGEYVECSINNLREVLK